MSTEVRDYLAALVVGVLVFALLVLFMRWDRYRHNRKS